MMKQIELSRENFIHWLEKAVEEDSSANVDGIHEAEDLKEFALRFFENHKGIYVKKFLKEVCGYSNEEIDQHARSEHIEILEKYVEFGEAAQKSDDEDGSKNIFNHENYTLIEGQEIFDQCKGRGRIREENGIKVVDHFEIFNGISITYSDSFKIKKSKKIALAHSLCMIVNKADVVVAVGRLAENETEYRVIIGNDEESISYDSLKNAAKFKIIVFEKECESSLNEYKSSRNMNTDIEALSIGIKLRFSELPKTDKPLCIDFGTSNTTAGTYGLRTMGADNISCVEFEYTRENAIYTSKLLPTMAYVKSCADEENIEFLFGYEAKEKVIQSKYDTDATVYFELKRWITELNIPEKVIEDEDGNTCENVSRKEIISGYIKYVIALAEQYFKVKFTELHFSAPVKLKGVFIKEIQEMLPESEYKVYESSKCLDEGLAIVYDYIVNEIDKTIETNKQDDSSDSTRPNKVLILDCGGGTTDLVNCEYGYRTDVNEGDVSLEVSAQFENGNPNFGGNNITFRILQLIKIKMVHAFYDKAVEKSTIDELIPFNEAGMLDEIDKNALDNIRPLTGKIYDLYEKAYGECEKYIPTKYAESEFNRSESKRNYFYLWQLAEKIKVEFYKQANLATYNLENRIAVEKIDDFYLYRYDEEEDEIVRADEIPKIEVTNNEIKKIIYADIYAVMSDLFSSIDIDSFDKYKLSGQSCKVTLFQELLKEFITGRKLRETNLKTSNGVENLKLGCINGCIAFTRGVKRGEIVADKSANKVRTPKLIYTVNIVTKETIPIIKPEKPYGGKVFDQDADELKIEVRNVQDELARPPFEFQTNHQGKYKITMEEVRAVIVKYSEISADDLEKLCREIEGTEFTMSNKGMVIFATVAKDGYGFNLFQLYVKYNDEGRYDYYFPRSSKEEEYSPQYENFESVTATFFDGHR